MYYILSFLTFSTIGVFYTIILKIIHTVKHPPLESIVELFSQKYFKSDFYTEFYCKFTFKFTTEKMNERVFKIIFINSSVRFYIGLESM